MNDPSMRPIGGLYYVRLTIEGIKHQIEQALIDHDGAMRATVEKELRDAVDRFDFSAAVRRAAEESIRSLVHNAIERAVRDAFADSTVNEAFNDLLISHLRDVFKKKE